jgi:hypothetical protein
MRMHIDVDQDSLVPRVRHLVTFALSSVSFAIAELRISSWRIKDARGTTLTRFRVETYPRYGDPFEVEELQSDPEIAAIRTLERTGRTLHRRLLMQQRRSA